jgi:transcriptional regulator with XRE-family HTH domain
MPRTRTNTALGAYLRARRELLRPADAGLPDAGGARRRVPGLRREEVALLAGISPDYYLRLEQGRDHHPSPQVLDALASALRLDADATAHLHAIAVPAPRRPAAQRRRAPERLSEGVTLLMASLGDRGVAAYAHGKYMDVLAATPLMMALIPFCRPGSNLVTAAFFDPAVRDLLGDWERTTESAVGSLRSLAGPDTDDPRLVELVGELSVRSERFRELWGRHDIRPKRPGPTTLEHPQVGPVRIRAQKLAIEDAGGAAVVVYFAEPGSASADKLTLLASMACPPAAVAPEPL